MLQVENLTKNYTLADRSVAGGIRSVSFNVGEGEFYTLLGPSGCGKTTTLRSIAGLEEPSQGHIVINNRTVFDSATYAFVPANRRSIGMVFQSYAVWPHMTVFDNTAFPLRMSRVRRYSTAEIKKAVFRTLETMELASFGERSAAQLSGGQQQRLSLARALVAEPRLLLLDEPLSNLDALLREQMRSELRRLQKEVGVAAVYVTHDQSEALALSDRLAVMRDGRIVQIGGPRDVYFAPTDTFVANFIGRSNLLSGRIERDAKAQQEGLVTAAIGPVKCIFAAPAKSSQPVAAMVRPEHVVLTPQTSAPAINQFKGRIVGVTFLGETTEYTVRVTETIQVIARMTKSDFVSGDEVTVEFPAEHTIGVPDSLAPIESTGVP